MDQIKIQNLEVFGHHGVYPEETRLGQKFLVNATLYLDTREAGYRDDLGKSVNYGEVCHFITGYMKEHTFKLIESVTEAIAENILLKWDKVVRVDVEVKKPWAPIGLPLETVSVEITRGWHTVYLSIGSNMGDRVSFLKFALAQLSGLPKVRDIRVSSLIETKAYGFTDQPDFVNGAVELKTLYTPYEMLQALHLIEQQAGRKREIHWGPRTLDLDILFYDDEILEQPDLIVPHADMANRQFVLEPLAELCPGKVHPVLRKTVLQMRNEIRA